MPARADFLRWLISWLEPAFTPPHVPAGNDWLHCDRMARMSDAISRFLTFNAEEYIVACWLHNVDRSAKLRERITEEYGDANSHYLAKYLYSILDESSFSQEAQDRIADAVLEHSKRDDEPGDSTLLTALRIADKVDKLNSVMGIIGACAMRGYQMLAYDSTEEGKLRTIYTDFMRQLEWYGMLPSDDARALVPLDSLRFYCEFVRRLARLICEHTAAENLVENDLHRALGKYYGPIAALA